MTPLGAWRDDIAVKFEHRARSRHRVLPGMLSSQIQETLWVTVYFPALANCKTFPLNSVGLTVSDLAVLSPLSALSGSSIPEKNEK